MSSYEFWDELGKIFNAVVAYQEKSIEFNKRFISPWIRLGNVFEKQDRNKDAINAYERAIEIDPEDAAAWVSTRASLSVAWAGMKMPSKLTIRPSRSIRRLL